MSEIHTTAGIDLDKIEHTSRGFALLKFRDRYGIECSIQKSSLATEDAIWFGPNDADPKIMAAHAAAHGIDPGDGTGWVPFPMPRDVLLTTRMHLTRDDVAALLPLLQNFVETGELARRSTSGSDNPYAAPSWDHEHNPEDDDSSASASGDWIGAVIRDVAELPDRDSPADQPEMMLVSGEELRNIIVAHAPASGSEGAAETSAMRTEFETWMSRHAPHTNISRLPSGYYEAPRVEDLWRDYVRRTDNSAAPASGSDGTAAAGADGLLPRPFCGGEAKLIDQGTGSWRVACLQSKGGCGVAGRMTFDKGVTATAEWNRRTNALATSGSELADERAWFEREALRRNIVDDEGLERRASGEYVDEPAQAAWGAWQARAALAQQATPELCTACEGMMYWECARCNGTAHEPVAQQAGAPAERDDRMWDTNTVMSYLATLPGALDRTRANNVDDVLNALILMHRELPAAAPAPAAKDERDAPRWSKEPPTEQGEYWNWDGDDDHAPMIYHVLWSGTAKKCFVSMGQYDIKSAIWCDEFGGWWLPIEQPSTSDVAMSQSKTQEDA